MFQDARVQIYRNVYKLGNGSETIVRYNIQLIVCLLVICVITSILDDATTKEDPTANLYTYPVSPIPPFYILILARYVQNVVYTNGYIAHNVKRKFLKIGPINKECH